MNEVAGVRALCPGQWGLIQLVGKDAYGNRNGDVLGVEEARLVLPVETSRGDPGVRQPVERDVVKDVVSGKLALRVSLKDLSYEPGLAGTVAVVEHERRQIDRGVRQSIQRLRARRRDECVGHVLGIEVPQLLV